jgi:hypothetical protein
MKTNLNLQHQELTEATIVDSGNGSTGCEFGYEIIMVIPYVYYLHVKGVKVKVITSQGMLPFYYFLPKDSIEERYDNRDYYIPKNLPLKGIHFNTLNKDRWIMPPYKEYFSQYKVISFEKEYIIINNKYNTEGGPPINYLNLDTLKTLFKLLTPKYNIVYNRPQSNHIPDDNSQVYDLKDFNLIKEEFPNIIDLNILASQQSISYNQLQLVLGSKCSKQISVQGGTSILASLTGGTNLVYAAMGGEVTHNSFEAWYPEFSGAIVKSTSSYKELISLVNKYFV